MYPQPVSRESGIGGSLTAGKMRKITPEWQTEPKMLCIFPVDFAVACVKGKHHDGDVSKWTVFLPSIQVVPRVLSSCRT